MKSSSLPNKQHKRKRQGDATTIIPILARHNDENLSAIRTTTKRPRRVVSAVQEQKTSYNNVDKSVSNSDTLVSDKEAVADVPQQFHKIPLLDQQQQQQQQLSQPSQQTTKRQPNERVVEWESIRQRWKKRKYNLRNEIVDVGNAIYNNITLQQQQQQKRQGKVRTRSLPTHGEAEVVANTGSVENSVTIEQKQRQDIHSDDDDDDDGGDDDDGQKHIFKQLLQSSQRDDEVERKAQQRRRQQQMDQPQPQMTYSQIMEPWEYGKIPPKYTLMFNLHDENSNHTMAERNLKESPFVDEYKANNNTQDEDDIGLQGDGGNYCDKVYTLRSSAIGLEHRQTDQYHFIMRHVYYIGNILSDFSLYHYDHTVMQPTLQQILPKYHTNPAARSTVITSSVSPTTSSFASFLQRRNIYRALIRYMLLYGTPQPKNTTTTTCTMQQNITIMIQQQQNAILTLFKFIHYNDFFMKVPEWRQPQHQQQNGENDDDDIDSNQLLRQTRSNIIGVVHTALYVTKSILYDHLCQQNGINYLTYYIIQDQLILLLGSASRVLGNVLDQIAHHLLGIQPSSGTTRSVTRCAHHVTGSVPVGRRMSAPLTRLQHQIRHVLTKYLTKLASVRKQQLEDWICAICACVSSTTSEKEVYNDDQVIAANVDSIVEKLNTKFIDPVDSIMILITPSAEYVPIYGTLPPTPFFPLDRTNIIYGPTDKHEQVVHAGHVVDESIYKVTIASFVNQIATSRSLNCPSSQSVALLLQRQLLSLLEQIIRVNQSQYYKRLSNHLSLPKLEIPLAYYYRVIMEYCAIVMSGIVPLIVVIGDESSNSTINSSTGHMLPLIEHLYEFLESRIDHNGLQMFTKTHALFGMLRICKILPESGIEILGSPIMNNFTPLGKFKQLLEHLEETKYLTQQTTNNTNFAKDYSTIISSVNIGELEYTLYRSSTIFHTNCLHRDPRNIYYHCWYIGTLAASLILCSGLKIQKSKKKSLNDTYRTIRRPLPKFQEMRKQTAIAFRSLIHLCIKYPSYCGHTAILQFLEWNQLMSLLLGPTEPSGTTESYKKYSEFFRQLHTYHKQQCTNTTHHLNVYNMDDGENLKASTLQTSDDNNYYNILNRQLHELANDLECNPSSIDSWRAFIRVLGPIGKLSIESYKANSSTITWWGADRIHWWLDCLLNSNSLASNLVPNKRTSMKSNTRQKNQNDTPQVNQIRQNKLDIITYLEHLPSTRDEAAIMDDSNSSATHFDDGNELGENYMFNNSHRYLETLDNFITSYIDDTVDISTTNMNAGTLGSNDRATSSSSRYPIFCLFRFHENVGYDSSITDRATAEDAVTSLLEAYEHCIVNVDDSDNKSITTTSCFELIGYKIIVLNHFLLYYNNKSEQYFQHKQMYDTIQIHLQQLLHHAAIHRHKYDQSNDINDNNATTSTSDCDVNNPAFQTLIWLYRDMGVNAVIRNLDPPIVTNKKKK